jgi:hypothetical protein
MAPAAASRSWRRWPQALPDSGGWLRLGLIAAGLAAIVLMFDLFPAGVRYACLGVIVAVAALTSGERRRAGSGWWDLFTAGAALSIVGVVLAAGLATIGGIIALAGAVLVVAGAAIGFPPGE